MLGSNKYIHFPSRRRKNDSCSMNELGSVTELLLNWACNLPDSNYLIKEILMWTTSTCTPPFAMNARANMS